MTAYEILLMMDPELAEERQSELVARTRELVEQSGGTWRSHDVWGRRRLAYEIDHKGEGVYHLVVFEAQPDALAEIARVLKISEGVMRHMAVRHVEGSRTSAPREEPVREGPGPAQENVPAREYAARNVGSQQEEE